jgi:hypothetical protein
MRRIAVVLLGILFAGLSVVQAGDFEDWCTGYGIEADQTADPDQDGADNLFEFAYGGHPMDGTSTGTGPDLRLLEEDGTHYVEIVRLERTDQNPDDNWSFYSVSISYDLEWGMWQAAICEEVSRTSYSVGYEQVTLRTAIPVDGGGWSPQFLFFREYGAGIYAFMGGVYSGSVGKALYTYPFAEEGSRMVGQVLAASAWDYLELAQADGTVGRVEWDSEAAAWADPAEKLPQPGYGFAGWRTEDAMFFPNWFGKVVPYASAEIYCPKGETLIGNPYPVQTTLGNLVADPSEGDSVDFWDELAQSFVRYSYTEGFPPYFPGGWYDSGNNPVEAADLYIEPWNSVRYTTDEPRLLSVEAPFNEDFQGTADATYLVLSERTLSCAAGTTAASFEVYSLGGGDELSFAISNDVDWISCSSVGGTISADRHAIALSFDPTGLPVGSHTGYVAVAAADAANGEQRVMVVLAVEQVELDYVSISGAAVVDGGCTSSYVCIAYYTDGTSSNVATSASWSVEGSAATIDSSGTLFTEAVASMEQVVITAAYSEGGVSEADTLEVVVKNPALEVDYSYLDGPANPLVLSNRVFFGSPGHPAARIGGIAALEIYDCSFEGGENGTGALTNGTGLLIEDVASIRVVAVETGSTASGGDGIAVWSSDNWIADGSDGVFFNLSSGAEMGMSGMVAEGGNGGFIDPGETFGEYGGSTCGGAGFYISNPSFASVAVALTNCHATGGDAGLASMYSGYFNNLRVSGGDALLAIGASPETCSLAIIEGVYDGGNGSVAGNYYAGFAVADGGCGMRVRNYDLLISGGVFRGGLSGLAFDDPASGGDGVRLSNGLALISGGTFAGGLGYEAQYSGAGLALESSAVAISSGTFDSVRFGSGANELALSGNPFIASLCQVGGTGTLGFSGFSGVLEKVDVQGGTLSVSDDSSNPLGTAATEIEIGSSAVLQIAGFHAVEGSRIVLEPGGVLSGQDVVIDSGSEWTIDAGGNAFSGTVALATASVRLVAALSPSDVTVLGDGTTEVSGLFTSNATLYASVGPIPEGGFDAWAEGIAEAGMRGYADCPDGDGIANLMKYACGLPSGSYSSNLFETSFMPDTITNSAYMVIRYQKAKDVDDAAVYPEVAGSLSSTWSISGISAGYKVGETDQQETWQASIPCTSNGFIRLKAEVLP